MGEHAATVTFEKDETVFTNAAVEVNGLSGSGSPRPVLPRGCSGAVEMLVVTPRRVNGCHPWLASFTCAVPLKERSTSWKQKGLRGAAHPELTPRNGGGGHVLTV